MLKKMFQQQLCQCNAAFGRMRSRPALAANSLAWISKGSREPNSIPEWDLCSWMPLGIQSTESRQISVTKDILYCGWHPVPFTAPLCALLWGTQLLCCRTGKAEIESILHCKDRPHPTVYLQGQGFRWRVTEQWLQTMLSQCFFRIIKL